jgi:mRNA-degrading endonuclease toxin of MazEF toxin-antitoxin module
MTEAGEKGTCAGRAALYHAREIWWCTFGVNIGNELDGTGNHHDRPVLVIRPFNAEASWRCARWPAADPCTST